MAGLTFTYDQPGPCYNIAPPWQIEIVERGPARTFCPVNWFGMPPLPCEELHGREACLTFVFGGPPIHPVPLSGAFTYTLIAVAMLAFIRAKRPTH